MSRKESVLGKYTGRYRICGGGHVDLKQADDYRQAARYRSLASPSSIIQLPIFISALAYAANTAVIVLLRLLHDHAFAVSMPRSIISEIYQ